MSKAKAILLSAGALTVIAAAAWAQQAYYPQKPSPAVPSTGQQAMSYDQALALQQSWNGQSATQPEAGAASATAPVGVDPDGNPVYRSAPGANQQPASGNAAQNEAQIAADSLRQNPQAAEQPQQYAQAEPNGYAPQAEQSAPQQYGQPSVQQPYPQQYQQPYAQQAYPQQQPYAAQDQNYGYADPQVQAAPAPPAVAAEPYAVYPPPPAVVYGSPYPYGYPYSAGIRIGGYYRGYPYVGGYYRGYAPGFRGGYPVRGGYGLLGRGYVGGGRVGGFARGGPR